MNLSQQSYTETVSEFVGKRKYLTSPENLRVQGKTVTESTEDGKCGYYLVPVKVIRIYTRILQAALIWGYNPRQ